MEIQLSKIEQVLKLSLNGRLDGVTASIVEKEFQAQIDLGERLFVFDLTHVSYISSAGLRAVLIAAKKTKSVQGKLAFVGLDDNVKEVFDMSGFSTILSIYSTEQEAIQAFQA
ncbi:anti-sigma factor antagonist [Paenibacillus psychroresistens]|uniref:Anti-sigma factor antagonist n=1 Tax=Paenibacillus psychroresistens TaxID=1778678 RepID=A0A6B8RLM2_9BACL|nr:STAS domain-containing protein [Paenibacillus psychroresistens]QGQ96654.1 anti-sigma factor antagonist [Paenibacillus psychroresistens]